MRKRRSRSPVFWAYKAPGWFVSSREAMHLSSEDWKDIEIRNEESKRSVAVRLSRFAGTQTEKIALLELKIPLPDVRFLSLRMEPLVANERVLSVAYAGDRLRVADGRFVEYRAHGDLVGAALFELYDGNDRLAIDHIRYPDTRLPGPSSRRRQQHIDPDDTDFFPRPCIDRVG
jgi:hypothetical protein